ncbi:hypothetical protein KB1_18970 [Cutibacterium modestum]|uniref:Uncharacterized protein n=1 Tax=Cutibacterium modestum TaxID=2559073 RepID=A0AAD1KR09_9ACTN|nr:hypothetical protein KB1_18970 [Cutibacterium modestum]
MGHARVITGTDGKNAPGLGFTNTAEPMFSVTSYGAAIAVCIDGDPLDCGALTATTAAITCTS